MSAIEQGESTIDVSADASISAHLAILFFGGNRHASLVEV